MQPNHDNPTIDDPELTPAMHRALRRHFPCAVEQLRRREPFNGLDPAQRALLHVVLFALSWDGPTPSQSEIATLTGFGLRKIRQTLAELQEMEVIRTIRGVGTTGDILAGRQLVSFLETFSVARNPRVWWSDVHRRPTPSIQHYGSADTHAIQHQVDDAGHDNSGSTPIIQHYGSDDTHAIQHQVDDAGQDNSGTTPLIQHYGSADTQAIQHYRSGEIHAESTETYAIQHYGLADTHAIQHQVSGDGHDEIEATPSIQHYGSADTHAIQHYPSTRISGSAERRPVPFAAAIPKHIQTIRVEPEPSSSTAATRDAPAGDPPFLIKKNKDLNSSFSSSLKGDPLPLAPTPATQVVDAPTARRLALVALAALHHRANPGIPLPRACDAGDVRLVEACVAKGTWDAATLEQTLLDAIEGAFDTSTPGRTPTPMYIWGQFKHFLHNARVGRAKRLKPKPAAPKPKASEPEEIADSAWLVDHLDVARQRLGAIPDICKPKLPPRFGGDPD